MYYYLKSIVIKYSFQKHLISTRPYQNEYVSSTIVKIIKPEAFQRIRIFRFDGIYESTEKCIFSARMHTFSQEYKNVPPPPLIVNLLIFEASHLRFREVKGRREFRSFGDG